MKVTFAKLATLLVAPYTVAGHTIFTTLFVNDISKGDGTCVRMPMTPSTATFPINNLAGAEMACGFGGTKGVARVCPVSQSAKLSFEFRTYPDNSEPGSLDPSHKGPCAVYMKRVDSAIKDQGVGNGWFKIWDDGYDSKTAQWCTEKLIENNGFLSVKIPSNLAGGYYLVRPELLSLHEADKSPPNPQFYAGCAQIFLKSIETDRPIDTVNIPGYVSAKDSSVLFNIYEPKFPYKLPGPAVYTNNSPSVKSRTVQIQAEGLLPNGVVLTNANWWGVEMASYASAESCRTASESCWDQCTKCYDTAPPTGSKNCKLWEAKCQHITDGCDAENPRGPPDAGKILTPSLKVVAGIPDAAPDENAAGFNNKGKETSNRDAAVNTRIALIGDVGPSETAQRSTSPIEQSTETGEQPSEPTPMRSSPTDLTIIPISTATAPQEPVMTVRVSQDAKCGQTVKQTCLGSNFGSCCSENGWCGSTEEYCGNMKCQPDFGSCGMDSAASSSILNTSSASPDTAGGDVKNGASRRHQHFRRFIRN